MKAQDKVRGALRRLISERGVDMATVSRAIGKNHAYIQQYLTRGIPQELSYKTAMALAEYFNTGPHMFGIAPANDRRHPVQSIRRLTGLDVKHFARALNEREEDIAAIENGILPLTEKTLLKICQTFQIDPADLAGYATSLSQEERVMLLRLRRLTMAQRKALEVLLKKFEKEIA